jgi:hypothetical protein
VFRSLTLSSLSARHNVCSSRPGRDQSFLRSQFFPPVPVVNSIRWRATQNRMILYGMLDLCRLILAIVIDLFRPRAAAEAEILVLRQQIIVLRRGRRGRVPSTGRFWVGSASCFRRPTERSPSFGLIPWCGGIAQVSAVTGAGSRGLVGAVPECWPRSGS